MLDLTIESVAIIVRMRQCHALGPLSVTSQLVVVTMRTWQLYVLGVLYDVIEEIDGLLVVLDGDSLVGAVEALEVSLTSHERRRKPVHTGTDIGCQKNATVCVHESACVLEQLVV